MALDPYFVSPTGAYNRPSADLNSLGGLLEWDHDSPGNLFVEKKKPRLTAERAGVYRRIPTDGKVHPVKIRGHCRRARTQ